MWPLLKSIFLTAKYYTHGWDTCLSINTTTPVMEPVCDEMFGYLPTYRQIIKPRVSVSLFDELLADLWPKNEEPRMYDAEIKYGVCHTGKDLASRDFMHMKWDNGIHGRYLGDSKQTVIFNLEALVNIGSG